MIKTLLLAALAATPAAVNADELADAYQNASAAAILAQPKPALAIKLYFEKGAMKVVNAEIVRIPGMPEGNGSMRVELWRGGADPDSSYAIPDPLADAHVEQPDGTHGWYQPNNAYAYVYADLSKAGVQKLVVIPLSSGTRAVGGEIDLVPLLATACAADAKKGFTKPAACP